MVSEFDLLRSELSHGHDRIHGYRPYLSPERLRGMTTMRSDIFSAGGIIYFMATGKDPIPERFGVNLDTTGLSPELAAIIVKATEAEPGKRYADAEELFNDLQSLRGDCDD